MPGRPSARSFSRLGVHLKHLPDGVDPNPHPVISTGVVRRTMEWRNLSCAVPTPKCGAMRPSVRRQPDFSTPRLRRFGRNDGKRRLRRSARNDRDVCAGPHRTDYRLSSGQRSRNSGLDCAISSKFLFPSPALDLLFPRDSAEDVVVRLAPQQPPDIVSRRKTLNRAGAMSVTGAARDRRSHRRKAPGSDSPGYRRGHPYALSTNNEQMRLRQLPNPYRHVSVRSPAPSFRPEPPGRRRSGEIYPACSQRQSAVHDVDARR